VVAEELKAIAAEEHEARARTPACINVCGAAGCQSPETQALNKALLEAAAAQGYSRESCMIRKVGCLGLCGAGPLIAVEPGGFLYQCATAEDAPDIVASLDGSPVKRLQLDSNIPFFTRQKRIVLENSGRIDPERLEDYIAFDGYSALAHVLSDVAPAQVIAEVHKSGLRGRGGAGYPTGLKWGTVAKAAGSPKTVICNADEGDPGAFMDRSVLESDPHRVLEGMAIAAFAVGASEG
jgi:bidirectional [NiFe] hydrogenase diaphorase subunit